MEKYGGRFVPEVLMETIKELKKHTKSMQRSKFQKRTRLLLAEFVGRPTPLYLAENLTRKLEAPKFTSNAKT